MLLFQSLPVKQEKERESQLSIRSYVILTYLKGKVFLLVNYKFFLSYRKTEVIVAGKAHSQVSCMVNCPKRWPNRIIQKVFVCVNNGHIYTSFSGG